VLTADLVNARRRGVELRIATLDAHGRERAGAIGDALVAIAEAHVGRTREELVSALSAVEAAPREHRLRAGLVKLIEDRCEFDVGGDADPEAVRRDVFVRASAARAALAAAERFDRGAVVAEVARARGTSVEAIERALFADLRGSHILVAFEKLSARALVAAYERAQAQAVLLRAVGVRVDVQCASAHGLRALFRRLKFLRLLHTVSRHGDEHRIFIDGPFSLFESVTKYGLALALVLPALEGCDRWRLEADIRWGKERTPLLFRLASEAKNTGVVSPVGLRETPAAALPHDVEALVRAFRALETPWRVAPNTQILDLPGVGLSIPDLVFERRRADGSRARVYFEVMGYWSRTAVWKRVELVRAGLSQHILFAVSAKLRVSEDVLDEDLPGALYVYKQIMSARTVAERLERLVPDHAPG
jgi:predicted nuclease of restriction endonuclease-like RecB superfamily